MKQPLALLIALMVSALPVYADPPEIVGVDAVNTPDGWRFDVTLRHGDTGWDHYADGWEILSPDGTTIGTRKLHHPHVNEQPFTRSLSGVTLEEGVSRIRVRAHCSVHGWTEPSALITLMP